MNIGIGISLANYRPVPTAPLEDPDAAIAALFGSGEVGAWYDPSDSSTVWQDAAGTTPATVGDPVGRIDDKSGNGNHATQTTSAARPVLQQSGDLYYLDFDGVDDSMAVTFASAQAQPNTLAAGYRLPTFNTIGADIFIDSPVSGGRHVLYNHIGIIKAAATTNLTGYLTDTSDNVILTTFNTTSSNIRKNGASQASGDTGTNTWGGVVLGRYGPSISNWTDVRIYSFVGVNRTLTAAEITDLETYLASKSGVTL